MILHSLSRLLSKPVKGLAAGTLLKPNILRIVQYLLKPKGIEYAQIADKGIKRDRRKVVHAASASIDDVVWYFFSHTSSGISG